MEWLCVTAGMLLVCAVLWINIAAFRLRRHMSVEERAAQDAEWREERNLW